jgi:internalin A
MRTKLFVCYSHVDKKFRNELTTQLQPCSDAVELWSDQSIPAGVEWLPEIDRALTTADAAVIVVSPDLLASEFIRRHELPQILKRHQADGMRPLWIHYRPALYDRTPLAALQCLHDPQKPLSTLRKPVRDQLLLDIVKQICQPKPQRLVANVIRAADEVFTAEQGKPSVTAQVRPDRIDMKRAGGGNCSVRDRSRT